MRPRKQKQPQVKKDPCREQNNVDVDVDVDVSIWTSDHLCQQPTLCASQYYARCTQAQFQSISN